MTNLWVLLVTTALVLITLVSLTLNKWSPHICNTVLTKGNVQVALLRKNTSQGDFLVIINVTLTEVQVSNEFNH